MLSNLSKTATLFVLLLCTTPCFPTATVSNTATNNTTAYVTIVSGTLSSTMGYVIGALALAESIALADPDRRRLCLVTANTLPAARDLLKSSGLWEIVELPPFYNSFNAAAAKEAEITSADTDVARRSLTFTKLCLFDRHLRQLSDLFMFLFIDADAFVRQPFELKRVFDERTSASQNFYPIAAARSIAFTPERCVIDSNGAKRCFSEEREFNTGVLFVVPGKALYDELGILDNLYELGDERRGAHHWKTDQAALNELLNYTLVTTLDAKYNTLMCCSFYDTRIRDAAQRAYVAHFSLSAPFKPWEMMRYEALVKLGVKTVLDYKRVGVTVPWFLEESVLHAVYNEWKGHVVKALNKLGKQVGVVERYMLRERDFLDWEIKKMDDDSRYGTHVPGDVHIHV